MSSSPKTTESPSTAQSALQSEAGASEVTPATSAHPPAEQAGGEKAAEGGSKPEAQPTQPSAAESAATQAPASSTQKAGTTSEAKPGTLRVSAAEFVPGQRFSQAPRPPPQGQYQQPYGRGQQPPAPPQQRSGGPPYYMQHQQQAQHQQFYPQYAPARGGYQGGYGRGGPPGQYQGGQQGQGQGPAGNDQFSAYELEELQRALEEEQDMMAEQEWMKREGITEEDLRNMEDMEERCGGPGPGPRSSGHHGGRGGGGYHR